MMPQFTLNNDSPTSAPIVHQLMHQATTIQTTDVETQATYKIVHSQLVASPNLEQVANPLPQLDLLLDAQLTGYDDKDGQPHQVVNLDANDDTQSDENPSVPLRYHVDTGELIQMLRGGLNDQPDAYQSQLNETLKGQTFTRPDVVQLSQFKLRAPYELTGGLTDAVDEQSDNVTVSTVSTATTDYTFDSDTKDNSFTYTLGKVLHAGIVDHQAAQQNQVDTSVALNPDTGVIEDTQTGQALAADDPRRLTVQANRDTYIKRVQDAKDAQSARKEAHPIENKDTLDLKSILKKSDKQATNTADPDITLDKMAVPSELFANHKADDDLAL